MSEPDWKVYQNATAEVFRRLGCNAQVDLTVAGVRASHAIDGRSESSWGDRSTTLAKWLRSSSALAVSMRFLLRCPEKWAAIVSSTKSTAMPSSHAFPVSAVLNPSRCTGVAPSATPSGPFRSNGPSFVFFASRSQCDGAVSA